MAVTAGRIHRFGRVEINRPMARPRAESSVIIVVPILRAVIIEPLLIGAGLGVCGGEGTFVHYQVRLIYGDIIYCLRVSARPKHFQIDSSCMITKSEVESRIILISCTRAKLNLTGQCLVADRNPHLGTYGIAIHIDSIALQL